MKPYKIINDSMLNMLNHIEENSIDCIITDPPYELGFMGKSWDSTGIAFNHETWEKCFKALKPGGYLLAFGGSRTFHRIACAIEDAGFELRDTIMYLYGTGFPKSMNIAKGIEGKILRGSANTTEFHKLKGEEINTKIGFSKQQYEQGARPEDYTERHKSLTNIQYETALAKHWQGWGSQLKPAYEPIIVARKPFKTSLVENVMIYGVGGINIDECRVKLEKNETIAKNIDYKDEKQSNGWGTGKCITEQSNQGRFPSNVITDGSEEAIKDMPNTNGFYRPNCVSKSYKQSDNVSLGGGNVSCQYNDEGSASRYFYCAKASKKDRDEGLDTLEAVEIRGGGGRVKNGYDDGDEEEKRLKEAARKYGAVKKSKKNTHPTVKPCELMQYLIRLVAPKGATILDPFMGSGSTGKAVMFENRERNADYKFIGIDLEKEYCAIAEMRIDYALNKYEYDFKQELQESKEKGQLNLFDMEENL